MQQYLLLLIIFVLHTPALLQKSYFKGERSEITRQNSSSEEETERLYEFKKCGGAGCPYTASWLISVNLYRQIDLWLHSTKMEAASFVVFDKVLRNYCLFEVCNYLITQAKLKFQLSDPDAFYVHHMSMYEHLLHKSTNFSYAKAMSEILAEAAFLGECKNLSLLAPVGPEYVAFVPFYGGLPPNVTKELKVHSLGQGNSLVRA
jgi:hypothetical protein